LRKIRLGLLLLVLVTGCFPLKNAGKTDFISKNDSVSDDVLKNVEQNNLVNDNFYIEKSVIKIINGRNKEEFLGSLKFNKPDKYLLSLKSRTGIEAVRVLYTGDSIFINDRINRKFYYGSKRYLKKKIGLSELPVAVLLGDYIKSNVIELTIKSEIDNRKSKVIKSYISSGNKYIEIKFSDFKKSENKLFPGKIIIEGILDEGEVSVEIKKVNFLWNEEINMIKGNKFERIELL
jgi:hypothetical protein